MKRLHAVYFQLFDILEKETKKNNWFLDYWEGEKIK